MNTVNSSIDGMLVASLMRQFHNDVPQMGSVMAAQAVSNTAHAMHKDFAWTALALAIANQGEVWDALVTNADSTAKAETTVLALSGPVAQRQCGDVEVSPIVLRVGEAGTYTAVHSKAQLREILQNEPTLVDSLKRSGKTLGVRAAVRVMMSEAPEYLVKEIFLLATNPKYAAQGAKGKILRDGELVVVKAAAHADLSALVGSGNSAYRIGGALNRVVQAALKLNHWWVESAQFWANVPESAQPVIPEGEVDTGYAGGEDTSWSSPLKTYMFDGQAPRMEQWVEKNDAKQFMAEDFLQAAQDAEAFLTSLSELLENAGIEVTYAWEVIDIAAKQFRPITNRAEAEDMLVQRTLANNEKRAAQALQLSDNLMEQFGLVNATLSQFDTATAAMLSDLRKEFGHE
jgi:hypothetical protein